MAGDREADSLVQHFDVAKPDYAVHAEQQTQSAAKQHDHDAMGLKSGSVEGIHKTSAAASKDAQDSRDATAERKAKQQISDALFLELLRSGDLDTYIAENVFGGKSDAEITDIVAMIEAETGQSFESYSRNILGNDMPTRSTGESDVDYNRRVVIAVSSEILDGQGNVLPQYENDPLAKYIKREASYIELIERRDGLNAVNPNNIAPAIEAKTEVGNLAAANYDSSDLLGDGLNNSTLSGIGTDIQDRTTDTSMEALTDNSSGFGAALAMSSEMLNTGFKTAAAPPVEGAKIAPEQSVEIKPVLPA